jgi:hypothetical protein
MGVDFGGVSAISHEHSWPVISAFFEKEGLVSQQLSSFNYFINNLKTIVNDSTQIQLTPNRQYHVSAEGQIVRVPNCLCCLKFDLRQVEKFPSVPFPASDQHLIRSPLSYKCLEIDGRYIWCLDLRLPSLHRGRQ